MLGFDRLSETATTTSQASFAGSWASLTICQIGSCKHCGVAGTLLASASHMCWAEQSRLNAHLTEGIGPAFAEDKF